MSGDLSARTGGSRRGTAMDGGIFSPATTTAGRRPSCRRARAATAAPTWAAAAAAVRAPRRRRSPPLAAPLAALLAAALLALLPRPARAAAAYNPAAYNRVCRYVAKGVPLALFRDGTASDGKHLFPLEADRVAGRYPKASEACFGPKEPYSVAAVMGGAKLPCRWELDASGGAVNYEEVHACDVLLQTNCYW